MRREGRTDEYNSSYDFVGGGGGIVFGVFIFVCFTKPNDLRFKQDICPVRLKY